MTTPTMGLFRKELLSQRGMRIRGGQTDAYSGMKNKNEALIDRQMCACV